MSKIHIELGGWIYDKQKQDLFGEIWEKDEAKETEGSLRWYDKLQKIVTNFSYQKGNYFLA